MASIKPNCEKENFDLYLLNGWIEKHSEYLDEYERLECTFQKGEDENSISIGLIITYGWRLDTEGNWITLDDEIEQFRDLFPNAKRLSDKEITGILFARFTGHKKGTNTRFDFYRGVTGDYQINIDVIGDDGTEEGKNDFKEAEKIIESLYFHDSRYKNVDWLGKGLYLYDLNEE